MSYRYWLSLTSGWSALRDSRWVIVWMWTQPFKRVGIQTAGGRQWLMCLHGSENVRATTHDGACAITSSRVTPRRTSTSLTLSLPRVIKFKFPLQPHQKHSRHIVLRTWLFIAYSDGRWLYYQFSAISLIHFLFRWENVLFELRSGRVKLRYNQRTHPTWRRILWRLEEQRWARF